MPSSSSQWYFRKEDFRRTPSVLNNTLTLHEELVMRAKACHFIQKVGHALKVSYTAIATACVLFHRFYMRLPFGSQNHYKLLGGTCIYLASKIEEDQRKLRDVALACARMAGSYESKPASESDRLTKDWCNSIIAREELLLEYVCFDLTIQHPYSLLVEWFESLNVPSEIRPSAWAFANDSFQGLTCLIYRPQVVAASALYLATEIHKFTLTVPGQTHWWEYLNVSFSSIEECSHDILDIYQILQEIQAKNS